MCRSSSLRLASHEPSSELARLLSAAGGGDATAWARLVTRFGPRIARVTRGFRLAPHDRDDVVQTTWLRLLENLHRIRNPDGVGAWLETSARRESLRVLQAATRECLTDDDLLGDAPWPEADDPDPLPALRAAVGRLPERQRHVVVGLIAERSYDEIARRLAVPLGSIGPTRARALARLARDAELADAVS